MPSWRDHILSSFTPQASRLTLVADPDGLLLEEGMLQGIRERGFELIPFDDPIAFRYAYESRFRSRWDDGHDSDLVVVLRCARSDLGTLPYDLLHAGRHLAFSLTDLFPHLSYPVVAALAKTDLDALWGAQERSRPEPMGDNGTKDFILRHVFGVAPEVIQTEPDLMHVLLLRHYSGQPIPRIFDERLIEGLRQAGRFMDWPLEQIVSDREAFFGFLQERWEPFVRVLAERPAAGVGTASATAGYALRYPGPVELPFGHDQVRVYMDNLFAEGRLKPVVVPGGLPPAHEWAKAGAQGNAAEAQRQRVEALIQTVHDGLPAAEATHETWLRFASQWAELRALVHGRQAEGGEGSANAVRAELADRVARTFAQWVQSRYATLHNQPPVPPVMVHHIPRALARVAQDEARPVALVVIDGLALEQWVAIRDVLQDQAPDLTVREQAVFAWLPTVTSVSRQALLAGKLPLYFPDSIGVVAKEETLWRAFWADVGVPAQEVRLLRGHNENAPDPLDSALGGPACRALGLVVDTVDAIMHGMQLGAPGMFQQVRQWAESGYLTSVLRRLLDNGFGVFVTSDHGNVEVIGVGQPREGAAADVRGERVRVFADAGLRRRVAERHPGALEWPPVGLPDHYLPLLAPQGGAFVTQGDRIVAHGGLSMEELVVPLVRIDKKE